MIEFFYRSIRIFVITMWSISASFSKKWTSTSRTQITSNATQIFFTWFSFSPFLSVFTFLIISTTLPTSVSEIDTTFLIFLSLRTNTILAIDDISTSNRETSASSDTTLTNLVSSKLFATLSSYSVCIHKKCILFIDQSVGFFQFKQNLNWKKKIHFEHFKTEKIFSYFS